MNTEKQSGTERKIIFREIKETKGLLELLRLRYVSYKNTRLRGLCRNDYEAINVDQYDLYSRHYGLYHVESECPKLIGGLRVAETELMPAAKLLSKLTKDYRSVSEAISLPRVGILPHLCHCPEADKVEKFLDPKLKNGARIVEPSRLLVQDSYSSIRLACSLVESAIALYFFRALQADCAVLTCAHSKTKFYARFGFSTVPDTSTSVWYNPGLASDILFATPSSVSPSIRAKVAKLAIEYETTGQLVFSTSKILRRLKNEGPSTELISRPVVRTDAA